MVVRAWEFDTWFTVPRAHALAGAKKRQCSFSCAAERALRPLAVASACARNKNMRTQKTFGQDVQIWAIRRLGLGMFFRAQPMSMLCSA